MFHHFITIKEIRKYVVERLGIGDILHRVEGRTCGCRKKVYIGVLGEHGEHAEQKQFKYMFLL